jgi:hypothetical protein
MKGLDIALRALAKVEEPLEFDVFGAEEDSSMRPYAER